MPLIAPRGRTLHDRGHLDVAAFTSLLLAAIWILQPLTGGTGVLLPASVVALAIATASLRRRDGGWRGVGFRIDNLLVATGVFVGTGLLYVAPFLLFLGDGDAWNNPPGVTIQGVAWSLFWSFLQQFCLLGFMLSRLRDLQGDTRAVVIAAALFSAFHLPNPFLTVFTFGAGLLAGLVFLRFPNLYAATLSHAILGTLLPWVIPNAITGHMKVGPFYW